LISPAGVFMWLIIRKPTVATLYYERLLSSQDKAALRQEASSLIAVQTPADPRDFIRDPYILEFIDAQPGATLFETELETGLIQQLQPS
jgi:predicted nuclease of restriction endonuclease-like (RecB) superfamily